MREVRQLLRRLADEGRTVFVSSHILAEIEQTCDRVAILSRGRCVANGSVAEVMAAAESESSVLVKLADPHDLARAARVLTAAGLRNESGADGLRVFVEPDPVEAPDPTQISRILGLADLWPVELRHEHASLEDVFLELTAEDRDPEVAA